MQIYQGIIEDNNDPLKLYRCKVRIFGIHTENRSNSSADSYIPVEDLPWALTIMQGSGVDEQGEFTPIANGSAVIVSFLDPEKQKPIIIGTIPRFVETLPDFGSGFSDPNQEHPKSSHINESTISRLARNEKISDTIIQNKKDEKKSNVSCSGVSWSEPETPYDPVYPNNRVIQTKNHIFEMDDTTGKERIHIYHKSGTSREIHPNGDEVNIIKNKKFTIVLSDDNILIEGNQNIRIDGDQNITIVGDQNLDVDGNQNITIVGDQNLEVETSVNITSPIINLEGTVNLLGDATLAGALSGAGSINLSGSIIDGAGNTNHHSH